MREIKFRGKRTDNGEWLHGNLVYMHAYGGEWTTGIQMRSADGYRPFASINVDPKSVGEYTGLKDRNGKEIYEGDLVAAEDYMVSMLKHWGKKPEDKNEIYTIKYHEASFKLFDHEGKWVAVLNHHVMSKADKIVVIANIYEGERG